LHENLIALIENSSFNQRGKPNEGAISKANLDDIFDFCTQFSEITSYENIESRQTIYTHSSSEGIGGGRAPCGTLSCRSNKIDELIQFSTLYSDRVYIKNFFHDLLPVKSSNPMEDWIRYQFANDIPLLLRLYPLIKSGNIVPVTFTGFCPHCLTIESLSQSKEKEYERACKSLYNEYYDTVEYTLSFVDNNVFDLKAIGPEYLIPHSLQWLRITNKDMIDSFVKKISGVVEKTKRGMNVKLTKSQSRKIEVAEIFAGRILNSVAFELGGSQLLGTSYLTDNKLEVDFIRNLTDDPIAQRRTVLMQKYLSCIVPFIENIEPSDLINLRKVEKESFIQFRAALTKAVEEYKIHGSTFTERDAQAVYADLVQPQLATMESKVKKAKRHFVKDSRRKIIGWVGSISVGLFTGFLTSDVLSGSAAFAATKVGAELFDNIMAKSDTEESIKDDSLYFLWKVKKLSE
jgi:hypothetical protein